MTYIQVTDNGDGSAKATVSFADEDYRFTISGDTRERAVVEFEEKLDYRGIIRTTTPDEEIFRELMISDEVSNFLESNGYTGIRRL